MRQISRNYNDKPSILKLSSTLNAWNAIAFNNTLEVKRSIYSDPYKDHNNDNASKVTDYLNKWYLHKCAYCERIYKMDVDHYRPKGEVRDFDNKLVQISDGTGGFIDHPGYYWLGYEWSNLVPACISCNRDGGKNSKFPTTSHYVFKPSVSNGRLVHDKCQVDHSILTDEKPLLLHPECDIVTDKFSFEIDIEKAGIKIKGKDPENRGGATIIICQMNRPEIRIDRYKSVVYPIRKAILSMLKLLSKNKKTLEEVRTSVNDLLQTLYDNRTDNSISHTYLRNYIMVDSANFESIVIPFMPSRLKKVVLTAFNNYTPS